MTTTTSMSTSIKTTMPTAVIINIEITTWIKIGIEIGIKELSTVIFVSECSAQFLGNLNIPIEIGVKFFSFLNLALSQISLNLLNLSVIFFLRNRMM